MSCFNLYALMELQSSWYKKISDSLFVKIEFSLGIYYRSSNICLFLLNAGILNDAESYYLMALSIV